MELLPALGRAADSPAFGSPRGLPKVRIFDEHRTLWYL